MAAPRLITPKARLSFPKLTETDEYGKYKVALLIPKNLEGEELQKFNAMKKMMQDQVMERWPDKTKRPPRLVNPIKDGDTDQMEDGTIRCERYPEMKGHYVINLSTKRKPGIVDAQRQPILDVQNEVYAGCLVIASVTCFSYAPSKQNPQSKAGVGFGLQNIMKVADGESFGGGSIAEDDFADVDFGPATASDGVTTVSDDDMFA